MEQVRLIVVLEEPERKRESPEMSGQKSMLKREGACTHQTLKKTKKQPIT